jgi:murein DD-endopeptidase MepM/ murein hydrolase activator NlpD
MSRRISQCFGLLLVGILLFQPFSVFADEAADIQQQIKDRQGKINTLKKQSATYEANMQAKRREAATLANQISILTDRIEKTKIDIETIQTQIESTTLEIRHLENDIHEKELELAQYREELGTLIRWLARSRDQSPLRVVFTTNSFADFTNQVKYLKTIELGMTDLIGSVESTKTQLTKDKTSLVEKRHALVIDVDELDNQHTSLEGQQETKTYLLSETKSSEQRYAELLEEARREEARTSAEITSLEQQAREKLKERGISTNGAAPAFMWPVSSARGITATFHDSDYPFRRVFEHTGIDIRAAQGTPIRASASGYIAQARTGGAKGYGFVMIVHDGGLATVYGHVSQILVAQDSFVSQGQVIARSGGLPGTQGAGPFSTGAHLHFEVRKGGIPVNPLNFLP